MNLFILDHTVNKNVLVSQHLTPLSLLQNEYQDFTIMLPIKYRDQVTIFPNLIGNIIFYKTKNEISRFIRVKAITLNYIYVRSIFDFVYIKCLKLIPKLNYSIVYDFRGLAYAEFELKNTPSIINNLKKLIIKRLEKYAYIKSDKIHAVSYRFRNFLSKEFKHEREVTVIPCCVSTNAFLPGKKKKDSFIRFVYLGSISKWQNVELSIQLFKTYKKHNDNCSLTIITNDIDKAYTLSDNFEVQVEIKSIPHHEVLKELRSYHFGFLLREDNIINKVASPLKFLEYLNAGVIPIITDHVGDYSELVRVENIGIVFNGEEHVFLEAVDSKTLDITTIEKFSNILNEYNWNNFYNKFNFS